jgi:hypothetical protein
MNKLIEDWQFGTARQVTGISETKKMEMPRSGQYLLLD